MSTPPLLLLPPSALPVCPDHSIYDSFSWMDNYGDPGFEYFRTAACLWGLMALRLADSAVLPFDPTCQATAMEKYLADLADVSAEGGSVAAAGK